MISRVIIGSVTVKKLTLHFPVAQVELPLCATAQAFPVRAPPARKRTAKFRMPATKHSRHKTANFSRKRLHYLYLSKSPEMSFTN